MATRIGNPYHPMAARSSVVDQHAASATLATGALGQKKLSWLRSSTRPTGVAQATSGSASTGKLSSRSIALAKPGASEDQGAGTTSALARVLELRKCVARLHDSGNAE